MSGASDCVLKTEAGRCNLPGGGCPIASQYRRSSKLSYSEGGLGLSTERLNAFSDGVIAILITIMVLELRVPHTTDLAALRALLPVFLTYVLSFVVVGIS